MKKSYHSIVVPTALAVATRRASLPRSSTGWLGDMASLLTVLRSWWLTLGLFITTVNTLQNIWGYEDPRRCHTGRAPDTEPKESECPSRRLARATRSRATVGRPLVRSRS